MAPDSEFPLPYLPKNVKNENISGKMHIQAVTMKATPISS